MYDITYIITMP